MPAGAAVKLSPRARIYLATAVAQHAIIGGWCLLDPDAFTSSAFAGLRSALPFVDPGQAMATWGMLLANIAVLCLVAVVAGSEGWARAALLASVAVEGMWLGGYLYSVANGLLTGPVGPVIWTAVVARDLTMLRQPLRNPFEPVVRRVLAGEGDDLSHHEPAV